MEENKQKPALVCAADDGYTIPLAVTLYSVFTHLKIYEKLQVFVLDGGVKKSNKSRILKNLDLDRVDINWVPVPEKLLPTVKGSAHVTSAAYYRLLIPEILPNYIHKVIYLDSDLIVIDDLGNLWDMDVENTYLLAVQDMAVPYVSSPLGLANYKQLGYSPNCKYFNTGVMVINVDKWREDNICDRVLEYIANNSQYVRWWDQDGLNAILAEKWKEIHPKWNQQAAIYGHPYSICHSLEIQWGKTVCNDVINFPSIVHYSTANKPWKYGCDHPKNELFFTYLDRTTWQGWRPGKRFSDTSFGPSWKWLKEKTFVGTLWHNLKHHFRKLQRYLSDFL